MSQKTGWCLTEGTHDSCPGEYWTWEDWCRCVCHGRTKDGDGGGVCVRPLPRRLRLPRTDMTLRRPAPTTLSHDTVCAVCGRTIPAGEPVRRTRGIGRHNGMWLGTECWSRG